MEKTPPMSDESRVGFSPTNPHYFRAISAETGRALERLAEGLEGLAREKKTTLGEAAFELHVDIPWDFTPRSEYPVGRPAFGEAISEAGGGSRLDPIDLSGVPHVESAGGREEAQRRIRELADTGRGEGVARFGALASASHLTLELIGDRPEWRDLPVEVDTHGRRYAIRMDFRGWLDRNIPHPESCAAEAALAAGMEWDGRYREKAVEMIAAGFVVGFGHAPPGDFPAFLGEPLLELLDAEIPDLAKPTFLVGEKKALALVQFGPCVLDGELERAVFTIGASVLVFDEDPASEGIGRSPTLEETPAVVAALRELARAYRPEGATIFGPVVTREERPPEVRRAKAPSLLLDVRARMDPETVKLSSFAVEGTLPRRWRKARRWEEAEAERVAELLRQHGDAAFEKTDSRPALLVRRRGGTVLAQLEQITLTTELGTRGGFIRSDSDGEWLVRALRVGAGFVTVGISWYSSAEKLISERRDEWATTLRSRLAEGGGQRRLAFDDLSDDEKEKIERVLEHIGTLEDARRILDLVLRRAFATGASVVDFPAHELRLLLECDGPEDRGNERIRRGLAALEHLSFKVVHRAIKGTPSARFQGRFVAAHYYFAAGDGARSDGVFVVELASPVPGVATLLGEASRGKSAVGRQAARAALDSSTQPTATGKSLELLTGTKADDAPRLRQRRRKGDRPAKALSTLGPYRKRAVCSTIFEERAFDFIEGNLTTSLAADLLGRKKRERKEAGSHEGLRVYSREWCPLLADGEWVAALGTHRRLPEMGWTLAGRGTTSTKTGGGRPAGLIDHVGRAYPSGSAHAERRESALATLADFTAVLEPFGGVLVGVRNRRGCTRNPAEWVWVSLEEALTLSTKELVAIRWYPFLPADWTRRGDELIEERQAARVARGEGERPVFVTRNPADYLAAAERDGVAWRHRPGGVEELETWPADGRERPAPDVRPLGERLAERIEAEGMRKGDVAKAFGVSPASLSRWLRPLAARDEKRGSGVPAALAGLVERWIEGGPLPTAEELEAVSSRRGRPRESGVGN
jgi:hypothetical protein